MIGFYTLSTQNERHYQTIDKRMIAFHTKRLVGAGKRFVFVSSHFCASSPIWSAPTMA
jgi:hypothetical protein